MPKTLAPGMANVPVNITEEERAIWGRLAFSADQSMGALLRKLIAEGARNLYPQQAAEVTEVRKRHRADALRRWRSSVLLGIVGWVTWQTCHGEGGQFIRAARRGEIASAIRAGRGKEMCA